MEGVWKAPDGKPIFWSAEGPEKPRFILWMIHGMGEHQGRYADFRMRIKEAGGWCLGFDLRGHGKSGGKRGHAQNLKQLCNDIQGLFEAHLPHLPEAPVFGYGHSLGGQLLLDWYLASKPPLKAMLVSAPYLTLAFSPPAWKVSLGKAMAKVWPSFSQATGLETAALSKNQKVVDAYRNDPLVHGRISASMFLAVHAGGMDLLARSKEIQLPLLAGHGSKDRITSFEATKKFVETAPRGQFWAMEEGWHELHHEPENETWFMEMFRFIEKHIPDKAEAS